ncbi:MAG: CapA family protein [Pseudomonadota bacterium]|nr:CapA family protein [Pseudomonadota bacterium]
MFKRRAFLKLCGTVALGVLAVRNHARSRLAADPPQGARTMGKQPDENHLITLFLCGDVMTGRGIDQVLPFPNDPRLYEPWVQSAMRYVALAEAVNGPISRPVDFPYIWGDALAEFERISPDVRIINLETAVTSRDDRAHKGIHYRMHPKNIAVLTAAGIDCAVMANNHVLDWGQSGLTETLSTLHDAGIKTAGAGADIGSATTPAILKVGDNSRVLVFSYGAESSGIPRYWAARADRPGVALVKDLSAETVRQIAKRVTLIKRTGDIAVVSLHWGGNWGYEIPPEQTFFAHRLIDEAGVDVVHGHSSHHVKAIEVYRDRPILYGCGDFISDYEGIEGNEPYRDDLGLMYFVTMDPASGKLVRLAMTPTRLKRFRINQASNSETQWLEGLLNREGRQFGTGVTRDGNNELTLHWGNA